MKTDHRGLVPFTKFRETSTTIQEISFDQTISAALDIAFARQREGLLVDDNSGSLGRHEIP